MQSAHAIVRDECGVAVVLALVAMLPLSALIVVLLAMSALEPQIASNLATSNQARYLAEAGVEAAFDGLARVTNWNAVLAGPPAATCAIGVIAPGTVQSATLPGLSSATGTYTVRVRNDCSTGSRSGAADSAITGVPLDTSATSDTNERLILVGTGTIGTATRTITVVLKRSPLPPVRGAIAFPGASAHVDFSGASFTIRGLDTNPDGTAGPGSAVLGIAVGVAANEAEIETALSNNPQTMVDGRSQFDPTTTARGADTVAFDSALSPERVLDFVNAMKRAADVTLTAGPSGRAIRDLGRTCDIAGNGTDCWGTDARPKIVYVTGTSDARAPALDISGTSSGSGVLIVEDGSVSLTGDFRWHGPVILTGHNVKVRSYGAGTREIYGALTINELNPDAPPSLESDLTGTTRLLYSSRAIDTVMTSLGPRRLLSLYSWQEQ